MVVCMMRVMMYVCLFVCMHVSQYVCLRVCAYVCMCDGDVCRMAYVCMTMMYDDVV